jgi:hypothetical protein
LEHALASRPKFLFHNHEPNSAIQLDLGGSQEFKELQREHKDDRLQADGWRLTLLSYRRSGLVVKTKHKLKVLLEWFTTSNGDILFGLCHSWTIVLHGFHNIHVLLHLPKNHMLVILPVSLVVQMKT